MTDCFFFPEDPACPGNEGTATTTTSTETGAEADMTMGKEMSTYDMVRQDEKEFLYENNMGIWAQLGFLQVAATGVTMAALNLFRY